MGFVPLFVFWAAEDPLSTSGHDWVGKPIIHSSCPGDVASTGTNATDKLTNRLEKIVCVKGINV